MEQFNRKFKLGLALGSGGAKGMAHLGALKALEEEGFEFDFVAGTSIGSIVGALYAKGYSSDDMSALFKEVIDGDPALVLAFTLGVISLTEVIDKFTGGAHFSDLKKPFRAVAVDADSGKEVVFKDGELSLALAASSAIPPFKPVVHGGRILVDGAFLNYVPSDVVKDLGADFVLAVNLGKGRDLNDKIKADLDDIYPNNRVPYANRSEKCYKFADFVLEPDLSKYTSASFGSFEEMYEIGYQTVKKNVEKIRKTINAKVNAV
ncbi:MAG: patatin-like phospholipase family protein [Clostridia bacterium]|nr:patatin-like phospholipase family protein [Clostridia bacterium]